MSHELTEEEIRADERRKTAQYIGYRLRQAQNAERNGGNDARLAAFAFAEIIANNAAREHPFSPASPDSPRED